ncbi:bifunctional riboflavin kinase/FAD synthetase [Alphaproteobacteria bacterium]|nr:bifunctional riboflavin kinase/FAD synthetase [Alphaproteobacteria bacterium]
MKVYNLNTKSDFDQKNLCLTIGNFDGIHKGHQSVIKKLIEESKESKLKSALMTFTPHPKTFFGHSKNIFNITTKNEKLNLLQEMGLDIYVDFEFDEELANLSADDFIQKIIIEKLNVKKIVIGSDFKFGKDRKGNLKTLRLLSLTLGFDLAVIDILNIEDIDKKFSSSYVREMIMGGNFELVSKMLNRNWRMIGTIVKGNQKARQINFPTANLHPEEKILPKMGVYCVKASIDSKMYKGVANFGYRPTVDGSTLLLEVHLFDFNEDIYGKELTVEFLTFIRPEQKFDNFEKLTNQIQKDIITAKNYHQI